MTKKVVLEYDAATNLVVLYSDGTGSAIWKNAAERGEGSTFSWRWNSEFHYVELLVPHRDPFASSSRWEKLEKATEAYLRYLAKSLLTES